MPKYKKFVELVLYIQQGDIKQVVEGLAEPAPSIFETTKETELRFSVELSSKADFLKYHSFDHLEGKKITVGVIYPDNDVEIKSTFTVTNYERRFGTNKGSIITHVLQGQKGE